MIQEQEERFSEIAVHAKRLTDLQRKGVSRRGVLATLAAVPAFGVAAPAPARAQSIGEAAAGVQAALNGRRGHSLSSSAPAAAPCRGKRGT